MKSKENELLFNWYLKKYQEGMQKRAVRKYIAAYCFTSVATVENWLYKNTPIRPVYVERILEMMEFDQSAGMN